MAANSIVFSCIKNTKSEVLEKDSDGYYKITLGALNAFNSLGDFYLADGVKDLIEKESYYLGKKLKEGYLTGEMGHPICAPGTPKEQYFNRYMRIDMENVSHHIKSLELVLSDKSSGMSSLPNNSRLVKVVGWVKPAGPKGDYLKQALENSSQNVAFSVRSITNDSPVGGVNVKKVVQIITYDWVVMPGISIANKYDTMSLEHIELPVNNISDLIQVTANRRIIGTAMSAEDDGLTTICKETMSRVSNCDRSKDAFSKW